MVDVCVVINVNDVDDDVVVADGVVLVDSGVKDVGAAVNSVVTDTAAVGVVAVTVDESIVIEGDEGIAIGSKF